MKRKLELKKKMIAWAMILLLIVMNAGVCLAEGSVNDNSLDLTGIIQALATLAVAVVTSVFGFLYKKHIQPFLRQRGLEEAARIAVRAVEAAVGRGNGEQKLEMAIDSLIERGFNFDKEKVKEAILAAWLDMNLEQIMTGVKIPE
ncbi:MAG: hypothetical protein GYA87_05750 [Christensenellaceae bacterium]|nr:hypothetical protein [Christensenellaceae bacterium]